MTEYLTCKPCMRTVISHVPSYCTRYDCYIIIIIVVKLLYIKQWYSQF